MNWEYTNTWPEVVGTEALRMDATKALEDFPYLAESSRRRLAVLRRCPTTLTILAAALAFGLGVLPMSTRGDGLTSSSNTSNTTTESLEYTLTTTQAISPPTGSPPAPGSSNAPTPQIVAVVTPVSIVQPASTSTSALQIFADSTKYYINSPSQLSVEIANIPNGSPAGTPITSQALGLSFYGQGLAAGSSLTFSLPFSQSVVGNPLQTIPQFTAYDPTTGEPISTIQIKYDGLAPSTTTVTSQGSGGSGTVTVTATPEPLSLLVWSVLAGIGLWRARGRRPYGPRMPLVGGKSASD
jgi:hypothetical protein